MKKIFLLITLLGGLFQSLMAFNLTYDVKFSEQFIQEQVDKKFPITKKKFFVNFVLSEPKITLKDNSEFVYLDINVNMNNGKKINTDTYVQLRSKVNYENKTKDITLVNFEVIKIDNKHLSPKLNILLEKVVQWTANKKLNGTPVYNLNKIKNEKVKMGAKYLKNISVKNKNMIATIGF